MRNDSVVIPILKLLLVVVILVAAGAGIYFITRLPAPSEKYRVGPANGEFSIIRPPDWEAAIKYAPQDRRYRTTVDISPPKTIGKGNSIFLGQFVDPPNQDGLKAAGMKDAQFQGKPTMLISRMVDGRLLWRMIFARSGRSYELVLWLEAEEDVPNSRWWPYLMSVQTGSPRPVTTGPLPPSL